MGCPENSLIIFGQISAGRLIKKRQGFLEKFLTLVPAFLL
ncbi:hypothetical protein D1AOALGA4SA_8404 [Olavius algarvensis Delta 1 endosymbiont]|nr:hypothetical protein D1AOALGA4SA_8404 [Olavius algarvensis Delta 1 endosymbiont]